MTKKARTPKLPPEAKGYTHQTIEATARPEVGTAPRFRDKRPPKTYRYDSSLSPALDWDTNPAREIAAFLLRCMEEASALPPPHALPRPRVLTGTDGSTLVQVGDLQDAIEQFKRLQRPHLNWTGKAEHHSFDVPTLPLFVHERLSTKAIIETLKL